jgi:hypothetical protein
MPKIQFLRSHRRLEKELEVQESITLNSYSLNRLHIVNTALKTVWRKGESAPLREERRREAKRVGRVPCYTAC